MWVQAINKVRDDTCLDSERFGIMATVASESNQVATKLDAAVSDVCRGTGPIRKSGNPYQDHHELWTETATALVLEMGLDRGIAEQLCLEMFRGLVVKSYETDGGAGLLLPPLLNMTWNAAMMYPGYRTMCLDVFGALITKHKARSTLGRAQQIQIAKEKYKQLFAIDPPVAVWGEAFSTVQPSQSNGSSGQGQKRFRDEDGAMVLAKQRGGSSKASVSSAAAPFNRLTLMSDDCMVIYFETLELSKAIECIMSSTTKIGEFFELIEQHVGLSNPRYMTAYDVRVNATDTCESLGLNDRDTVTLYAQ